MYFVYILKCKDGTLYTGITTDIVRRLKEHENGTGARYTRAHKGGRIVYSEKKRNRSTASKREAEIKSWPRAKKLALIKSRGTSKKLRVLGRESAGARLLSNQRGGCS